MYGVFYVYMYIFCIVYIIVRSSAASNNGSVTLVEEIYDLYDAHISSCEKSKKAYEDDKAILKKRKHV